MTMAIPADARKFLLGLTSLCTIVMSTWVAEGLGGECILKNWQWAGECSGSASAILCRAFMAMGLFAFFLWATYQLAKDILPIQHLEHQQGVAAHQVLVAAISPFTGSYETRNEELWVCDPKNPDKCARLSGNIEDDIKIYSGLGRWPDQQFLRALVPHVTGQLPPRGGLRHIVLIGSAGARGSYPSLPKAEQLVRLYSRSGITISRHPDPIAFEDIEALQETFDHWLGHFRTQNIAERDIIIDATGGQKTTSIAAALTTLRWSRIKFQYVQTEPLQPGQEPKVLGFNVVAAPRDQYTNG